MLGDEAGVGGDGGAVVAGRVRDVHAGQLTDRRLVLEDRLEHALAHLRLVRRVGGQELAALQDGVDDRGDVVVVDARAEERQLHAGVRVPGRQLFQVGDQLGLGERGLQIERGSVPDPLGNVPEEVLDRRDPDRCEHLLAIGVGEREVTHSVERWDLYASASISASVSAWSATRILTSHPSP